MTDSLEQQDELQNCPALACKDLEREVDEVDKPQAGAQ